MERSLPRTLQPSDPYGNPVSHIPVGGTEQIDLEIASLRKRQAAVAKNQEYLMRSSLAHTIPEPDLSAGLADLKREWDGLDDEVRGLEDRQRELEAWTAQAQIFLERCGAVSEHLDSSLSFAERRSVLEDFGVKITTDGTDIEVWVSVYPRTPYIKVGG